MRRRFAEETKGELTEAEAIRRVQSGDAAAFEYLYTSHSRHVYNLCLRMVWNTDDAEDLTQQIFLQVFRRYFFKYFEKSPPSGATRAFLYNSFLRPC